MAYEPTVWVNGETPINETNLNKMESGIKAAHDLIADQTEEIETVKQSFTDGCSILEQGVTSKGGTLPENPSPTDIRDAYWSLIDNASSSGGSTVTGELTFVCGSGFFNDYTFPNATALSEYVTGGTEGTRKYTYTAVKSFEALILANVMQVSSSGTPQCKCTVGSTDVLTVRASAIKKTYYGMAKVSINEGDNIAFSKASSSNCSGSVACYIIQ